MNIKKIVLSTLLCLALVGCSKPLPADKAHFAGTWISADSRVKVMITPEGRIEYNNEQPGKSTSVSAPIKSFDGDDFNAGVGPFSTKFEVSQGPKQDDQGNWFMIVDGYTLAKVN